jgi:large subunit ribosomal protein L30
LVVKRLSNYKSLTTNYKLNKMAKIKVTQIKSGIDRSERQKLTLQALGLTRMHATKEVEATPQILGMVKKVSHLIKVEELA